MTAFSDGLDLERFNPPQIVSFCQGFARRLAEPLHSLDEHDLERPADLQPVIERIVEQFDAADTHLAEAGIEPDADLPDYTPADISAGSPEHRVAQSASSVARRVSGVPTTTWDENPQLIDVVRIRCADAAWKLREVEERVRALTRYVGEEQNVSKDGRLVEREGENT